MTPGKICEWCVSIMICSGLLSFSVILLAIEVRVAMQVWREEIRHDKDRG